MKTGQTLVLTSEPVTRMTTGMPLVAALLNLFLTELSVTDIREHIELITFLLEFLLNSLS